jgi:hypothetical protein
MDPTVQLGDALVDLFGVGCPSYTVDPRSSLLVQFVEGRAAAFWRN